MFENDNIKKVVEETSALLSKMIIQDHEKKPDDINYVKSALLQIKTVVEPQKDYGATPVRLIPGKVKIIFECEVDSYWFKHSNVLNTLNF